MVVGAVPILRDGRLVRAWECEAAQGGGAAPGHRARWVRPGTPQGPSPWAWALPLVRALGEVPARLQEGAGFSGPPRRLTVAGGHCRGGPAGQCPLVGLPSACPPIGVWWGSHLRALGSVSSGGSPVCLPPGRCLAGLPSACPQVGVLWQVRVPCWLVHSTLHQRLLAKRPLDPKAWFSGLSRSGFVKLKLSAAVGGCVSSVVSDVPE